MFEHKFLETIPEYAIAALTGPEFQELDEHINKGCEICELELYVYNETAGRLPYALPNQSMPSGLKDQIWKRLDQLETIKPTSNRWISILRIAALLAAAVLIGFVLRRSNQEIAMKDQEIAELRQLLQQQKGEISWLRDPSVQLALLTGLEPAPTAKGRMVWNPSVSKGIFYAHSLPPLSKEKSYELWVIGSAGPVRAGVFEPDPQGTAVVTITKIESPAEGELQFAVTIEPRGGLPKPTGPMLLAGKPL